MASTKYEAVRVNGIEWNVDRCACRTDSRGPWNAFKAWYLFLIHAIGSILLLAVIFWWVDGRDFETGSPPTIFMWIHYQTQVTGAISFALVLLRLLAGACATLLIWRTVVILLEKTGLTLAELLRIGNYRIPGRPRASSTTQLLWSCWASAVLVLLWPPGFVAPLANSSIAWIPSVRLSQSPTDISMASVGQYSDWAAFLYPGFRMENLIRASMAANRDPEYVFTTNGQLPLRRYFSSPKNIPTNSTINVTLPYFDVSFRWINPENDDRSANIGNTSFQNVVPLDVGLRTDGTVAILRDDIWDAQSASPQSAQVFSGMKLVAVKITTMDPHFKLPDGTYPTEKTLCPRLSENFGELADVGQYQVPIYWSDENSTWAATDCYLVGEASVIAGKYRGNECSVGHIGTDNYIATCSIIPDKDAVQDDWISSLALDFTSETMQLISLLNFTMPWMHGTIDDYTGSILRLAYHATWSAITERLGNETQITTANLAESVVRASVNRNRLYIWLGLSAAVSMSAILVALGQNFSTKKTIRDSTLALLTLDLTEVTHSGRASGLCNAVTLNKKDRKLPRLKWKESEANKEGEDDGCSHRVVFAQNDGSQD